MKHASREATDFAIVCSRVPLIHISFRQPPRNWSYREDRYDDRACQQRRNSAEVSDIRTLYHGEFTASRRLRVIERAIQEGEAVYASCVADYMMTWSLSVDHALPPCREISAAGYYTSISSALYERDVSPREIVRDACGHDSKTAILYQSDCYDSDHR